MKKVLTILIALASLNLVAQTDKDTQALIDKAIAQFEKDGVEMKGVVYVGDGAFNLTLKMDHERFNACVADFALWFDSKTQWFLRSNELYISQPTSEEQQAFNPYLLMKNAQKHFDIRKTDGKQLPKGAVAGLQLTPRNYSELQGAKLFFDKDNRLVSLQANLQNGYHADVDITSFKNGIKYEANTFICNPKDYDADVIDMR